MKNKNGLFITIEGVEGVGKSTNIETIKQFLADQGIDFIVTREPGGTIWSEQIRDLLLKVNDDEDLTGLSELLLIFAARAQHLDRLIRPSLAAGKWVICDRFTDATYAYQGAGRGLDRSKIAELETLVQEELRPDLTIILDLDPLTGLQRAQNRAALDRFEREQLEFFEKVRQAYLDIASAEQERCIVVDASQDLEAVSSELLIILEEKLSLLQQDD
ncbi:MAG TPA: dTMP kinase [Gammaproteobacteria bacterium]|jgi:dTMP kinase|nr:dTMP kinase [Gammaproteobacteria bacterium]MDP6732318.1 dTMP kinase [Gammaproteobacteria bacterium]HAJ75746.1 dTMP kinase [Gammaproteobacteria bacterium]|tara:strand:- start:82 stop:732 length:651 start_codon:yes stop_codon:yes gene_type:complete